MHVDSEVARRFFLPWVVPPEQTKLALLDFYVFGLKIFGFAMSLCVVLALAARDAHVCPSRSNSRMGLELASFSPLSCVAHTNRSPHDRRRGREHTPVPCIVSCRVSLLHPMHLSFFFLNQSLTSPLLAPHRQHIPFHHGAAGAPAIAVPCPPLRVPLQAAPVPDPAHASPAAPYVCQAPQSVPASL